MRTDLIVQPARRFRSEALTPEVVDPRIADIDVLAQWLDAAFVVPGGFRFGVAGIIGLIPGIGDVIDALLSIYIVARAVQLGIPRVAVARMLVNVAIEAGAGSVPFAGNLFDVAFKANLRNCRLLKSHLAQTGRQSTSDWLFLIVTILVAAAAIAIPVALLIELTRVTLSRWPL